MTVMKSIELNDKKDELTRVKLIKILQSGEYSYQPIVIRNAHQLLQDDMEKELDLGIVDYERVKDTRLIHEGNKTTNELLELSEAIRSYKRGDLSNLHPDYVYLDEDVEDDNVRRTNIRNNALMRQKIAKEVLGTEEALYVLYVLYDIKNDVHYPIVNSDLFNLILEWEFIKTEEAFYKTHQVDTYEFYTLYATSRSSALYDKNTPISRLVQQVGTFDKFNLISNQITVDENGIRLGINTKYDEVINNLINIDKLKSFDDKHIILRNNERLNLLSWLNYGLTYVNTDLTFDCAPFKIKLNGPSKNHNSSRIIRQMSEVGNPGYLFVGEDFEKLSDDKSQITYKAPINSEEDTYALPDVKNGDKRRVQFEKGTLSNIRTTEETFIYGAYEDVVEFVKSGDIHKLYSNDKFVKVIVHTLEQNLLLIKIEATAVSNLSKSTYFNHHVREIDRVSYNMGTLVFNDKFIDLNVVNSFTSLTGALWSGSDDNVIPYQWYVSDAEKLKTPVFREYLENI